MFFLQGSIPFSVMYRCLLGYLSIGSLDVFYQIINFRVVNFPRQLFCLYAVSHRKTVQLKPILFVFSLEIYLPGLHISSTPQCLCFIRTMQILLLQILLCVFMFSRLVLLMYKIKSRRSNSLILVALPQNTICNRQSIPIHVWQKPAQRVYVISH